jgi:hypothetical protein
LTIFALMYGFFVSGFVSFQVQNGHGNYHRPTATLATFSIFFLGQGVGNLLAWAIKPGAYYAVRHESVVVFTGSSMVMSAPVFVCGI